MNVRTLLCCLWFCFLMFGCAQKLPVHESGYGLVAFPYHVVNSSGFSFLRTYEWTNSRDNSFSVKIQPGSNSRDVALSDKVADGHYTVDTVIVRTVNKSGVLGNTNREEITIEKPFVIKVTSGDIGLIPLILEVEQYRKGETIYIKTDVVDLDDGSEKVYQDLLELMENSSMWKIKTL